MEAVMADTEVVPVDTNNLEAMLRRQELFHHKILESLLKSSNGSKQSIEIVLERLMPKNSKLH